MHGCKQSIQRPHKGSLAPVGKLKKEECYMFKGRSGLHNKTQTQDSNIDKHFKNKQSISKIVAELY